MAIVKGTGAGDLLYGTKGNDQIYGYGGGDRLIGGTGTDDGEGNDSLYGGDGDDALSAGVGNDLIYGGAGNDEIDAEKGNDRIYAGSGDDRILYEFGDGRMAAPACWAQTAARWDLPDPTGPASTTTCDGQSGQSSIRLTASLFAALSSRSSRLTARSTGSSSASCDGFSALSGMGFCFGGEAAVFAMGKAQFLRLLRAARLVAGGASRLSSTPSAPSVKSSLSL